jgi:hypothetical protein
VADRFGGTVTKLRASDGKVVGTFNLNPESPYGLAFDGANMWVTGDSYLMELRATDGVVLGKWFLTSTSGIAFDGAYMWVPILDLHVVNKF